MVELRDAADAILVQASLDRRFKEGLGVKCIVRPVARGEPDSHTGVAQTEDQACSTGATKRSDAFP